MLRVEGAKWLAYYGWAQVGPMTQNEHDIHKLVTMLDNANISRHDIAVAYAGSNQGPELIIT